MFSRLVQPLRSLVSRAGAVPEGFPADAVFADAACLACPEPCPEKWRVADDVLKEVDQKDSLIGSIKPYSRHLLVSTGEPGAWPSSVEALDAVKAADAAAKDAKSSVPGKTIVGAIQSDADLFPGGADAVNLLHLPSLTAVSVPAAKVSTTMPAFLSAPESVSGARKLDYSHIILVCVHMSRDARCGTIGPAIIDALRETAKEKGANVKVIGCSHVGGHKYAGNVIVYPSGDWYGRVLPHHAPAIIEEVVGQGKIIQELWRGRIGE